MYLLEGHKKHVFQNPSFTHGGGGSFHSKGTWGCSAHKGILFWTSSLAKSILFGDFSRVHCRQGNAFWQFFGQRTVTVQLFLEKNQSKKKFCPEKAKIWQVLSRKRPFRALFMEKLV